MTDNEASTDQGPGFAPVKKGEPVTESERILQRLAERSFLSLWSYPGVYRDQSKSGGDGKEIADLLVVFGDDIIIFSDKHVQLPAVGPLEVQWSRWYRRSVMAGANQARGAERWIRQQPNRLFLDRKCTRRFPYPMPVAPNARFHRVVVAHGASERCNRQTGGTGSLMLIPRAIGAISIPFSLGDIDPAEPYVHVFDDFTIEIVMRYCDTITDFVRYLNKKEQFVRSGRLLSAAGEEEVLAYYLTHLNEQGEHDMNFTEHANVVVLDEGFYAEYCENEQTLRKTKADEISYAWDDLIESFSTNVMAGTLYNAQTSEIAFHEQGLRIIGAESRLRRRMLANAFVEMLSDRRLDPHRRVRVSESTKPGEPFYVFLAFAPRADKTYDEYRQIRQGLLLEYCRVVRLMRDHATLIVGIAVDLTDQKSGSQDLIVYDGSDFSIEERRAAESARDELGLFRQARRYTSVEKEYPNPEGRAAIRNMPLSGGRFPGTGRNEPCPCGQGKKYKKCCGP